MRYPKAYFVDVHAFQYNTKKMHMVSILSIHIGTNRLMRTRFFLNLYQDLARFLDPVRLIETSAAVSRILETVSTRSKDLQCIFLKLWSNNYWA